MNYVGPPRKREDPSQGVYPIKIKFLMMMSVFILCHLLYHHISTFSILILVKAFVKTFRRCYTNIVNYYYHILYQ